MTEIIYKCQECGSEFNTPGEICDNCFGPLKKIYPKKKQKRENTVDKKKAIKFLMSQRYKNGFKNKKIYEAYTDVIDFINKAIPDENQERLF